MLLKDFKGLYTNYDTKDINPEFLKESKNIRFYPGYMTTQFYGLEPLQFPNVEGTPVLIDTVYLDNDKLGVDSEFNSNYVPKIQSYNLLITRKDITTAYKYFIYLLVDNLWSNIEIGNGISIAIDTDVTKSEKNIFIYNVNGIIKIFLPHISLWLGKINRYYRSNEIPNFNNFYCDALIEQYGTKSIDKNQEIINGRLAISYTSSLIYEGELDKIKGTMIFHHYEITHIETGFRRWNEYYYLQDSNGNNIAPLDGTELFRVELSQNTETYDREYSGLVLANQFKNGNDFIIYPNTGMFDDIGDDKIRVVVGKIIHGYPLPDPPYIGKAFSISDNWNFISGLTVADSGFDITKPKFQLLSTCILDDNSEFIIDTKTFNATNANKTKFAIKLDFVHLPLNINRRITGFAFYIKFKNQTDYEQISLIRLQAKIFTSYSTIYLYPLKFTGIYLTQTIGKLFNEFNHKLLETTDDYIEIAGVSYGLKENSIYYPSIGNGQVQKDIFYTTNIIPELYNESVIALSNLNDYLAVHTVKGTKLIITKDSQYGSFLFFTKDSLGYNINKKTDVVQAYDGIGLLTNRGIYITNGQNDFLLSEQINDMVEKNYQNGILFYNEYDKLFYFFVKGLNSFFLFDVKEKKWTEIAFLYPGELKKVFNTIEATYLEFNTGFYKLVTKSEGLASFKTHKINLGNPKSYKIFSEITVDFEGEIIFLGKSYVKKERDIEVIPIKIKNYELVESKDFNFQARNVTNIYSVNIEVEEEAIII